MILSHLNLNSYVYRTSEMKTKNVGLRIRIIINLKKILSTISDKLRKHLGTHTAEDRAREGAAMAANKSRDNPEVICLDNESSRPNNICPFCQLNCFDAKTLKQHIAT